MDKIMIGKESITIFVMVDSFQGHIFHVCKMENIIIVYYRLKYIKKPSRAIFTSFI